MRGAKPEAVRMEWTGSRTRAPSVRSPHLLVRAHEEVSAVCLAVFTGVHVEPSVRVRARDPMLSMLCAARRERSERAEMRETAGRFVGVLRVRWRG